MTRSTVAGYTLQRVAVVAPGAHETRVQISDDALSSGVSTATCPGCGADAADQPVRVDQAWLSLPALVLLGFVFMLFVQAWLAGVRVNAYTYYIEMGVFPDGLAGRLLENGAWDRWVRPYAPAVVSVVVVPLMLVLHVALPRRRKFHVALCRLCAAHQRRAKRTRTAVAAFELACLLVMLALPSALQAHTPALLTPACLNALLVSFGGRFLFRHALRVTRIVGAGKGLLLVAAPPSWLIVLPREAEALRAESAPILRMRRR